MRQSVATVLTRLLSGNGAHEAPLPLHLFWACACDVCCSMAIYDNSTSMRHLSHPFLSITFGTSFFLIRHPRDARTPHQTFVRIPLVISAAPRATYRNVRHLAGAACVRTNLAVFFLAIQDRSVQCWVQCLGAVLGCSAGCSAGGTAY